MTGEPTLYPDFVNGVPTRALAASHERYRIGTDPEHGDVPLIVVLVDVGTGLATLDSTVDARFRDSRIGMAEFLAGGHKPDQLPDYPLGGTPARNTARPPDPVEALARTQMRIALGGIGNA